MSLIFKFAIKLEFEINVYLYVYHAYTRKRFNVIITLYFKENDCT